MGLYERIKEVANTKGYSINRLEKELGFARSSINKFNTNTPSVDKIRQIAELLDVSVDALTGKERTSDYVVRTDDGNELLIETYYLNEETTKMAQFMFENPNYKVLFDASRKVKPEDIQIVKALLDKFSTDN